MIERGKRARATLAALIGYAVLVALMTWPAPIHLADRLVGNNIDNWIFYWNDWRLGRAIEGEDDWLYSTLLFFPKGTSLAAHSNSFTSSLLALALRPAGGAVLAYNVTLLLGLWLSAVGMFLFILDLTGRRPAAFAAGFVYAFAPYHVTQSLAHVHLGSIHWWPFYALFLHRALRDHRMRDALCAGLFAALTFWTGLQLALLLALWTVCDAARWLAVMRGSRLRILSRLGIVAASALVLCLPLLVPLAREIRELSGSAMRLEDQVSRQTDLLAYFVPPTLNTFVGTHIEPIYQRFLANQAYMPYAGFAVLGLALAAAVKRSRQALFWCLSSGLWLVLAAGPVLRINGTLYPQIPLPYRLISDVFPISAIRAPDRFNLLLSFSLAVLAGLGTAALLEHRRRWLAPVAAVMLVEYLCVPLPAWENPPPSSPFLEEMADDPTPYAVVNYPMDYDLNKLWLYYQTIHEHPVVQGHFSRYTKKHFDFILSQPLLRALYRGAQRQHYSDLEYAGEESDRLVESLGPSLHALTSEGVRYVLVHKTYLSTTPQPDPRRTLPLVPVFEDETLAAYDLADPLPALYDGLPFRLTPGVALARFDVQPEGTGPAYRIQVLATLLAPRDGPLACRVELAGEGSSIQGTGVSFFDPPPAGQEWLPGDPALAEATVALPEQVEPGTYRWTLACGEGSAAYAAPQTIEIAADGQATYLRSRDAILYADSIRLRGYGWRTEGAELQVTLHWEALHDLAAEYKVFVHVLDKAGEIVRQYDAMPCAWGCPTSGWQAGEVVVDRAGVNLWGLPPGEYLLAVGLYDAATGERLPCADPAGEPYAGGYPLLTETLTISAN